MSNEQLKKAFFESTEKGEHEKMLTIVQGKGGKELINSRNEEGNTALHISVKAKKHRATRLLCGLKDVDANAENKDKNTALHIAAVTLSDKDIKILSYLLQRKEVNTIHFNSVNVTPIHLAVAGQKKKIV
jgi:ankyrin repeat protein